MRNIAPIFGEKCRGEVGDTEQSSAYVLCMLSTLLVIGGVLAGLLVLLALIVSLSAPPAPGSRSGSSRPEPWDDPLDQPYLDIWVPLPRSPTTEVPAVH